MKFFVALLAGCLLALPARAEVSGPFETLLLIDGQGEADDPLYAGWTRTLGFESSLAKEVAFGSGHVFKPGRPELREMGFAKVLDSASGVIFRKLTQGQVQSSMRIVFVQAGRKRIEVWELALTDVLFTRLETRFSSDSPPVDQVNFVARTVEWRYIAPPVPAGAAALTGEAKQAFLQSVGAAAVGTELYTRFDALTALAVNGTRTADFPGGADSDGDGMSDGYETTYGLNPGFNDAALDPDRDGMSNRLESICDTNPFVPDSVLRITSTQLFGGSVVELHWPARADIVYRIEGTPALGTAFTTVKTITATADGELVTTLLAGTNRFFRLSVDE